MNRSPHYFAVSGCILGVIIMVCFVAMLTVLGPGLAHISDDKFQTNINVGFWLLPLGLGALGYLWAKNRQQKWDYPHQLRLARKQFIL